MDLELWLGLNKYKKINLWKISNIFYFRYIGQWKDGKRDGYGIFYYANGSKYEG